MPDAPAPPPSTSGNPADRQASIGFAAGLGAFGLWGLSPLYFAAVDFADPWQVVAHRNVWTVVFIALLMAAMGRLGAVLAIVRNPRVMGVLALTSVMITSNWIIFVWAIQVGRLHEASLGYFINPLINVALGMIFLGERLNRWQAMAVGCAVVGVSVELVTLGTVPWVALALSLSFGFYGLLRKRAPVDALGGLLLETSVLTPIALGFLIWLGAIGAGFFGPASIGGSGLAPSLLLMAAGIVTAAPLVLFVIGAQRLPYFMIGLLQYVAPTLQFLIAVFILRETFAPEMLITFGFIWLGLAIFTWDLLRRARQTHRNSPKRETAEA